MRTNKTFIDLAATEALKTSSRPGSAIAENIELTDKNIEEIKDAAHALYLQDKDGNVAKSYAQATLNFLTKSGLLTKP